jgi:mono/diheme cytochrome c family protein
MGRGCSRFGASGFIVGLLTACLVCLAGCQQKMAQQPRYNPLAPSSFFEDGRSARPLVAGTVARGNLREDPHFYTGIKPERSADWAWAASLIGAPKEFLLGVGGTPLFEMPAYYDTFPFPLEELPKLLHRGQERFNIFCAVCHGRSGDGKGMIVQRGFTQPPAFATDLSRGYKLRGIQIKLRDVPVGYIFDVITNGYGAMPDYAVPVPSADRWAIIAYVRALQYAQNAVADQQDEQKKQQPGRKP